MPESDRRYPDYGPEVNAILDVARAARCVAKVTSSEPTYSDIVQHVEQLAINHWWSLIDIILDYEEQTDGRGPGAE